ncbi:MAG TPA: LEA type 2 family protein [Spirochaetia bacterium]|nr:LEA type 2 family protein [Spirochaetia bacterium]
MIRRLIPALILLCLGACLWAFELPGNLPKPTAEIKRFQLEAITLRDVTFLFELAVKNPYPVNLPFDGMTLRFAVEGARVFTAASQGGFTVPSNSEKSNTFTVTLDYAGIIKLVKDYVSKEWLDTVIDGTLVIPLPKLPGLPANVTFTYSLSKKIPAIKPHLAILNFRVLPPTQQQVADAIVEAGKKTDPGKALGVFKSVLAGKKPPAPVIDPADLDVPLNVSFTLEIRNDARGPLSFNKLGYVLNVNGEKLVTGESTGITREKGRDLVTITNTFSSKQLSKNVKALFSQHRGTFAVSGKAAIKFPDEIRVDPVPLDFNESGSFSL